MARILVIDDERNIRNMIRLALEHDGHAVTVASDGATGLNAFADGRDTDVVMLDQRMAGMSGIEVLREIRSRDPQARVIVITAFGTIELVVEAMNAGATDFLCKPFTAETLRNAVSAALTGRDDSGAPCCADGYTTYGFATLNGFRVERATGNVTVSRGARQYHFVVRDPSGARRGCYVVLPAFIIELAKARLGQERLPGGARFWEAFSEEALASHLLKHAALPPDEVLEIDDLTSSHLRWMNAVLSANRQD